MNKLLVAFVFLFVVQQQASAEIFWTDKDTAEIWSAADDGGNQQLVYNSADGLTDPRGLQINYSTGDLFVADHAVRGARPRPRILRGSIDGLTPLTPVIIGLPSPADMLVDWSAQKIYWAEQGGGSIRRADLNGANQETLLSGLPSSNVPYYLALDSAAGNLYWSDFNSGIIHRADITQANPIATDFITGLDRVRDLELDLVNQKIYWADRGDSSIVRRNLDGSGANEILFNSADGLDRPHGLALDVAQEKIYWTDTATGDVLSGNINGIGSPTVLNNGPSSNGPWQILVVPEPASLVMAVLGVIGCLGIRRKTISGGK